MTWNCAEASNKRDKRKSRQGRQTQVDNPWRSASSVSPHHHANGVPRSASKSWCAMLSPPDVYHTVVSRSSSGVAWPQKTASFVNKWHQQAQWGGSEYFILAVSVSVSLCSFSGPLRLKPSFLTNCSADLKWSFFLYGRLWNQLMASALHTTWH